MPTEVARLTPKEIADAIRKGRERYPEVHHTVGDWVEFEYVGDSNQQAPAAACAAGFAMLGLWNGDITDSNADEYRHKFDSMSHYQYKVDNEESVYTGFDLHDAIIGWNDEEHLSLDQIISYLDHTEIIE
jgi:hypothetical protein